MYNPHDSATATALFGVVSNNNAGAVLFAVGSSFATSGGINADDCGIYVDSELSGTLAAGATFVIASGLTASHARPIRFITGGTERARFTATGELLIGRVTNFDASGSLLDLQKNQNAQTYMSISNTTNGTTARVNVVLEVAGPYYSEYGATPAAYTGEAELGASVMFLRTNLANGVLLITESGSSAPIKLKTDGNNLRMMVAGDGGITVGAAPTGGSQGAGTINLSGDIYKNGAAYTNPDYALEHWATGKIQRFSENEGAKEYRGRLSLGKVEDHCRENFRLPGLTEEAMGAFKRSDFILEKVEELYTYLFDFKRELAALASEKTS